VLQLVKEMSPDMLTKSGLMVGLGETREELRQAFADLRAVGCDILTLGQYLQPTPEHAPIDRFVPPAEFNEMADEARSLGFLSVAAGPFVRSSYNADVVFEETTRRRESS
jgi:lipoic acid synthetase